MHARIVAGLAQPGTIDQGINIFENSVAPVAQEQKGFKDIFFLVNRDTNQFMSVTLWETEADMAAGEASSYLQEQVAKAAPILAAPPTTEHYELAAQTQGEKR